MSKYELLALDVWGNAKDGWELNAWYHTGIFINVTEEDTKTTVLKKVKKAAGITSRCKYDCVDFNEYIINYNLKRNGKPALYLQKCV